MQSVFLRSITIAICFVFSTPTLGLAAKLKPIKINPSYKHTKYAPEPGTDLVFNFRAYTVYFDGADDDDGDGKADYYRVPQLVSYEMRKNTNTAPAPSRPAWMWDKKLFKKGIMPSDASYAFSNKWRKANPLSWQLGYDRGHMCMKDHAWRLGPNADWNTHTLLNIVPQKAKFNQGIWRNLEDLTAKWADKYGKIWIMTGPVFINMKPTHWLGQKGELSVAIPDGFFKIVARKKGRSVKVMTFLYPHKVVCPSKKGYNHSKYLVPLQTIEMLTGYKFFNDKTGTEITEWTDPDALLWPVH